MVQEVEAEKRRRICYEPLKECNKFQWRIGRMIMQHRSIGSYA